LRAGEFVPGAQATVVRYGIVPHEAAEPPSRGQKQTASLGENQTTSYPGLYSSPRCEDYLFRDSLGKNASLGLATTFFSRTVVAFIGQHHKCRFLGANRAH
jgi:hypothetical protein